MLLTTSFQRNYLEEKKINQLHTFPQFFDLLTQGERRKQRKNEKKKKKKKRE